jgi:hypothetical protein
MKKIFNLKKSSYTIFLSLIFFSIKSQTPTTFTFTNAKVMDTLTSSNYINAEAITTRDTFRAKDIIVAEQGIKLSGDLKFSNTTSIGYKAPTLARNYANLNFGPSISAPPPSQPCGIDPEDFPACFFINNSNGQFNLGTQPQNNIFNGVIRSYNLSSTQSSMLTMGNTGWGASMIESEGNANCNPNSTGLLINYFCGRNTYINTGNANGGNINALGGWVYMGNQVNMAKHVEIGIPAYPINDAANIALDFNIAAGKGIRYTTNNNQISLLSINNSNFSISPFNILGDGRLGIKTIAPYKYVTVNEDVSFANYGTNTSNGVNGIEILGNNQIPTRRGISTDGDPSGRFNFYIHSFQTNAAFNFKNGNGNINLMSIEANGKVYVGTQRIKASHPHTNSDFQVWGKIGCKELVVVDPTKWADFVFDTNYKLKSLQEVETFYILNKHLPDVPSEKEVKENGINTAEMDATLLQKIEELYLHLVSQNKRIEKLEVENEELKKELKKK